VTDHAGQPAAAHGNQPRATIFYAVVLYLYATQQVDAVYLTTAWVFLAFRIAHSAVHCTFNFIPLRFLLYVVSALAAMVHGAAIRLAHDRPANYKLSNGAAWMPVMGASDSTWSRSRLRVSSSSPTAFRMSR
jgi:hypothetical protein